MSITFPGWESLQIPRAAGAARVWFGLACNITTTFDIFWWLQITVNFDDVSLLQSAPNRPDYINVFGLWLHRHFRAPKFA